MFTKKRIAVIVSRFNQEITSRLLLCCHDELIEQGILESNINVFWVPGAFEIPFFANALAKKKKWHAIICLGCVIKGETSHDQHVAHWAGTGCGQVSLTHNIPVMFGVLTPLNNKQAFERSKPGPLNRGKEVAQAACEILESLERIKK